MKPLGLLLIALGLIGLLYGGFSWTRKDKVVDAGPIEITADKHESLPIPPLVQYRQFSYTPTTRFCSMMLSL